MLASALKSNGAAAGQERSVIIDAVLWAVLVVRLVKLEQHFTVQNCKDFAAITSGLTISDAFDMWQIISSLRPGPDDFLQCLVAANHVRFEIFVAGSLVSPFAQRFV